MADEHKHEIVIIRRGGHGDHDEHHGGVWKIAFADFMTAMMAFFLVMWLISANDKTRASVARYFNPVRLVDATTQPRGLHETKKDESGITAPNIKDSKTPGKEGREAPETKAGAAAGKPETAEAKDKRLDVALRENPYVALAEIAATKTVGTVSAVVRKPAAPVIGRRGGDSFRDPFAPAPLGPAVAAEAAPPDRAPTAATPASPKADAPPVKASADRADAKAQILAALKAGDRAGAGPHVDVRRTSEGLLLSLTDTADFSMFTSGSAVPARHVVLLMERVAQVLKARPGTVIVRGFTDNKPFRSGRYDNWHLSIDRAQVTHYMLVRGGLDEGRIGHIEGFADRGGKPGIDAASPLNRRIEILLKDEPT